MLALTSYLDIRSREVGDRVWIVFALAAVPITVYEQMTSFSADALLMLLAIAGGTAGIAYGGYRGGLFGGADAKALITLALLLPTYSPGIAIHSLAPLMTLSNGVLLTLMVPVYLGSRNLVRLLHGEPIFAGFEGESRARKAFAALLGTRVEQPRGFVFPIETMQEGHRRFRFALLRDDTDFGAPPDSWVTPGLPLLVFFALGFFAMLVLGDLLALAIFSLV
jgi:preflagellin peptidase FlaK